MAAKGTTPHDNPAISTLPLDEKAPAVAEATHEDVDNDLGNLTYDLVSEEPEVHFRTYLATAAMFLLNLVQVVALQGPPIALSYIGKDLNNVPTDTWVPNALSLVQAVVAPLLSSASDKFQARKLLLVVTSLMSFVGCGIAPGSQTIGRLIAAQALIGFGFSSVPICFSITSEIWPRKWRPMIQAFCNVAAAAGACVAPLIMGAFVRDDPLNGWRKFYWVQMAIWGATAILIFGGYQPPKRHTRYDHLSWFQKLRSLDLPGFLLLTVGLSLFLAGLNLGGGLYAWTNVRVLATLIIGLVVLIAFALYEWLGTKEGILHHDLFRGGKNAGQTFSICVGLIFVEGVMLFSYVIFYPTLTTSLFATNPFTVATRSQPFWVVAALTTVVWGYASTKLRTIKTPLFFGFLIFTAGLIGFATIEPGQSINALAFAGLAGAGFSAPLILIVAGVQLSTPHHLIATATAVTVSARAIAATTFTAIYAAALSNRLDKRLPDYIASAALKAGLPATSLKAFVGALAAGDTAALSKIPGVNPAIIGAGVTALKHAFADSLRVIYIIAVPFGALACICCLFLGDLRKTMNYAVDAPVEELHAKHEHSGGAAA